jgi:HK97 family phage major capsid protein
MGPVIDAAIRQRLGPRNQVHADAILQRAAVGAGTPTDATWAGPLAAGGVYSQAFLELISTGSAFDALVRGGARVAPVGVSVPVGTAGTSAAWVATGGAIPLSAMAFDSARLRPDKVAVIAAFTKELVRASEAVAIVTKDFGRAIVAAVDAKLLSADAAVPTLSPAGLLNGVTASGTGSAATIESDLIALLTAVQSSTAGTLRLFVSKAGALALTKARSTDGAALYPDVALTGGTLLGVPMVVTEAAGANLILVDCDGVVVVDAGLELDTSGAAGLEMSDVPAMTSVTPTGANLVSMWQTDSTAFRAVRFVSWVKGRSDAVGFLGPLGAVTAEEAAGTEEGTVGP